MDKKLLKYQLPHFYQLEEILRTQNCALDASDTGTGKTYVAIALAHILGRKPFIICPKSVIPNWLNVAKALGVELFGIANYELIKGCKYYISTSTNQSTDGSFGGLSSLEKVDCPYMDVYDIVNPKDENKKDGEPKRTVKDYKFSLPSDVLVIFDEAHRCKNHKTITSRLLLSIYRSKCKMLLLSATISDKIDCFRPFGVVFGFYDDMKKFKMWITRTKKAREIEYRNQQLTSDQITLDIIHSKIFPEFGSRMKIKDLGSMFPSNQVLSQAYMSNNKEEIQEQYDLIEEAFRDLKEKETRSEGLGKLIRARMKIEMLKVPIMLDIIEEALDSNYSVVVFVNYKETMNYLAHYFETESLIHGDQTMEERQESIDNFQANKTKIIICIIQAGGVGISLHDVHGGHPRMSVISPTWSGQDMQQALGRIHRAGSKSPAMQRIVFCAETYEETICTLIQKKMTNISGINDRDLIGPKFTEELYEEIEKDLDKVNYDPKEGDGIKIGKSAKTKTTKRNKNGKGAKKDPRVEDSDDAEEGDSVDNGDDLDDIDADDIEGIDNVGNDDTGEKIKVRKTKTAQTKVGSAPAPAEDQKKKVVKRANGVPKAEGAPVDKKFKRIVDKTEKRIFVKKDPVEK
ncbi:DEXDc helicase [Yasminevirus sp. GU-2018]|uniref:DEXDc helicase n=1 Tax=Yasminevirus sp. GU-2018 TaxID=2420051 RepID=A0A5K0UA50_9VIRU|nr:DEXDc helicase [Yasminevirus sp. GU-2018]